MNKYTLGLEFPVNRIEKTRASYVAIASIGENPGPQLDAASEKMMLQQTNDAH